MICALNVFARQRQPALETQEEKDSLLEEIPMAQPVSIQHLATPISNPWVGISQGTVR
jgi:hypothetical protein